MKTHKYLMALIYFFVILIGASAQMATVGISVVDAEGNPLVDNLACPGEEITITYEVNTVGQTGTYVLMDSPFGTDFNLIEIVDQDPDRFVGIFTRCPTGLNSVLRPRVEFFPPGAPIVLGAGQVVLAPVDTLTINVLQIDTTACNQTLTMSECGGEIPPFGGEVFPDAAFSFPPGYAGTTITDPAAFGQACLARRPSNFTTNDLRGTCGGTYQVIRTLGGQDGDCEPIICTQTITEIQPQCILTLICPEETLDCALVTDVNNIPFPEVTTNVVCTFPTQPDIGDASCCTTELNIGAVIVTPGDCGSEFTATRVITYTATCGDCVESVTCNQTVRFQDTTPPVITFCPEPLIDECDDAVMTPNLGLITAVDDCSNVLAPTVADNFALPGPFTCPTNSIQRWVISVSDECGNQAFCTQDIVSVDTIAPVVTCPPPVITDCSVGDIPTATTIDEFIALGGTALDECSGANLTLVNTTDEADTGACPLLVMRTYVIADACGNTSSCVQAITINDTEPPTCTFANPADARIEVECEEDAVADLPVVNVDILPMDNCGIQDPIDPVVTTNGTFCGDPNDPLRIERAFTFFDLCGNSVTCVQTIIVNDVTAPILDCPDDMTLDCDVVFVPSTNDLVFVENCLGRVRVDVVSTTTEIGCASLDTITGINFGSDVDQQMISGTNWFGVTTAGPTGSRMNFGPDNISVTFAGAGTSGQNPNDPEGGNFGGSTLFDPITTPLFFTNTTDPLSPSTITISGLTPGASFSLDIWSALDSNGPNNRDAVFTVEGSAPQTADNPALHQMGAALTFTGMVGADGDIDVTWISLNGGGDQFTVLNAMVLTLQNPGSGAFSLMSNVYTATDICGNSASCTQLVTFVDMTPPTIDVVACETQDCDNVTGFAAPSNLFDACGTPVVMVGMASNITIDAPLNDCDIASQRVITVSDDCGNINLYTQKLVIIDTVPPVCELVGDGIVDFGCVDMRPVIDCVCFCDEIGPTNVVQMIDPLGVTDDPVMVDSEEINRDAVFNGGSGSQVGLNTFQNLLNMAYPNGAGGVLNLDDPTQLTNGHLVANFGGCKVLTISNTAPFQLNDLPGDGPAFTNDFNVISVVPNNPGANPFGGPISGTNVLYDRQFVFDMSLDSPGDCEKITHFGFAVLDRELTEEEETVMTNITDAVPLFRIDAAGPGFTDSQGNVWQADAFFNTGNTAGTGNPIANTMDDALYRNERWDSIAAPEMCYNIPVTAGGNYDINLHFANTCPCTEQVGQRIFNVTIEGVPVLVNYDIVAAVGHLTADIRSFAATTTDGFLDICFEHVVENPLINGIEIFESAITNLSTNTVVIPIRTEPTVIASANYTDGTSGTLISTFSGDNDNGENTWYGFAAPPGEGITSVTVSREIGNLTNDFRIDDVAFVTSCDNSMNLASQFTTLEDNCSDPIVMFAGETETNMNCCTFLYRNYIVSDECGNTVTCRQTFTWVEETDHEPPTVVFFPEEQDLGCNPTNIPSYDEVISTLVATDNCLVAATQLVKMVESTDGCRRSRTYVIRISDKCWNSIECEHTIRWSSDTNAPSVVADTLNLGCNPESIPSPNELEGILASDDCGDVTFSFDGGTITTSDCSVAMTRDYTVTDACGNSVTFQQNINWTQDDEAPVVTWPSDANLGCISGDGNSVMAVNTFEDSVLTGGQQTYFGMGGPEVITDEIEFPVFVGFYDLDLTETSLTLTLQDNSGAAAPVLPAGRFDRNYFQFPGAMVTSVSLDGTNGFNEFADVQLLPPGFVLNTVDLFGAGSPGPIVFENGGFVLEFSEGADYSVLGTTAQVNYTKVPVTSSLLPPVTNSVAAITAEDNCGIGSISYLGDHTSSVVNCQMTVTRFYRVLDLCGNAVDGDQTWTFSVDGAAPTLLVDDLDLGCNPQYIPTPNELEGIQAFDDCGDAQVTITGLVSRTTNGCTVTMIRGYEAADACGNVVNGQQTITWTVDNEPPAFTAHPAGGYLGCTDQAPAPDLSAVTATDNCDVATIILVSAITNALPGGCDTEAIHIYRATDDCGNSREVEVIWTWTNDDVDPTFTDLPQNIDLGCAGPADIPAPDDTRFAVTDNCGVSNVFWVSDEVTPLPTNPIVSVFNPPEDVVIANNSTASIPFGVNLPLGSMVQGVEVTLDIAHTFVGALSAELMSPEGTVVPLFANLEQGAGALCQGINLTATFSDAGAAYIPDIAANGGDCSPFVPPGISGTFAPAGSLASLNGEEAYGMWTLRVITDALPNPDGTIVAAGTSVSISHNPVPCQLEMVRSYTAIDNCGNSATSTVTFTWTADSTTPFTIYQYEGYQGCVASSNLVDGLPPAVPSEDDELAAIQMMSLDDCSLPASAQFITAVESINGCLTQHTRTYRITDDCGNGKDIDIVYSWHTNDETLGATITTPVDLGCSTVNNSLPAPNPADVIVTGEEACGTGATVTHLGDTTILGDCAITIDRLYLVTDECESLIITQQFTSILDTSRPFIDVDTPSIDLGCATLADVPAPVDVEFFEDDNCNDLVISNATITATTNQTPCLTTITRFYVFTDECGNEVRTRQVITLQESDAPGDTEPPVFVDLPTAPVGLGCNPDALPPVSVGSLSVTDNCQVANVEWVSDVGDAIDAGADDFCARSLVRTYMATDVCGNTSQGTITYTWTVDVKPPELQTTQLLDGDLGCNPTQSLDPDVAEVTATDICGGTNVLVELITDHRETNGCEIARLYIYRISDACGNFIDEEVQFSYKQDTQPPVFDVFPAMMDLGCNPLVIPNPDVTLVAATDQGEVNDGCGVASITVARQQSANGCIITVVDTYTATDECGNSVSQPHIITYKIDETDPEFDTFPADVNLGCNPTLPAPFAGVVTSDNCLDAVPSNSLSVVVITNGCDYRMVRTYTVEDACGNKISRDHTIEYTLDEEPPVFLDIDPVIDLGCNPTPVPPPDASAFTVEDNCDEEVVVSLVSEIDVEAGCDTTRVRTYQAVDGCGNMSIAQQTLIWTTDVKPPTILSVENDQYLGCNPVIPPADLTSVVATDDCQLMLTSLVSEVTSTVVSDDAEFGCNQKMVRTYRVMDACGNFTDTSVTFTWKDDSEAPEILRTPDDLDLGCNPGSIPGPNPDLVDVADNCAFNLDVAAGTVGLSVYSIPELTTEVEDGCSVTRTYVYGAQDECGNTITTTQTLTWIVDVEAPFVVDPITETDLGCNPDASELPTAESILAVITAGDNCEGTSIDFVNTITNVTDDDSICDFSLEHVYRITDDCGNSYEHSHIIHWTEDTEDPTIICPPDRDLGCNPASTPRPEIDLVQASDNCGIAQTIVLSETVTEDGCNRTLTVVYQTTDNCGNTAECTQITTWIVDILPPVFTDLPPAMDLGCNPTSIPEATIDDIAGTDDCGEPTRQVLNQITNSSGCIWTKLVTYRLIDDCGNFVDEQVTHTWLQDTTDPVIETCPPSRELGCNPLIPPPEPHILVATDDCSAPTTAWVGSNLVVNGCNRTLTYTYRVTDSCGNESECVQTLTFTVDNEPPTIVSTQAGGDLGCITTPPPAPDASAITAADDCGTPQAPVLVDRAQEEFECTTVLTFTYRIADDCGNATLQDIVYTYTQDTTPPVIANCPTETVYILPDEDCVFPIPDFTQQNSAVPSGAVSAMDNCGNAELVQQTGPDFLLGGIETVVLTATDKCGNDSRCVIRVSPATWIGNRVWNDLNANGLQDEGEPGLEGVTVNLLGGSGARVAPILASTTTDADGNYNFFYNPVTGVAVGHVGQVNLPVLPTGAQGETPLAVQVDLSTLPAGAEPTMQNQGGDDDRDSDLNPDGTTPNVMAPNGGAVPNLDGGIVLSSKVSGFVFNDLNLDMVANENLLTLGLNGVEVSLISDGEVVATATTMTGPNGEMGYYEFDNVMPGDYGLQVTADTVPASLPNTSTGFSFPISVESGIDIMNVDGQTNFGFTAIPTAITLASLDATGGKVIWAVGEETDTLGYNVIDTATGETVNDRIVLATGPGSSYEVDVDGPGTYSLVSIDTELAATTEGTAIHYVEVDASPVGEPALVEAEANGTAAFVTGDADSYAVLGVATNAKVLDVSNPDEPIRLIGGVLETANGTAVYFSRAAGASIVIE